MRLYGWIWSGDEHRPPEDKVRCMAQTKLGFQCKNKRGHENWRYRSHGAAFCHQHAWVEWLMIPSDSGHDREECADEQEREENDRALDR